MDVLLAKVADQAGNVERRRPLIAGILALGLLQTAAASDATDVFGLIPHAEAPIALGETSVLRAPLARLFSPRVHDAERDPRSQTFLTLDAAPGLSLLCDGRYGLQAALADVELHCLQGRLDGDGWTLGQAAGVGIEHRLRFGAENPFDLRFGLSWLQVEAPTSAGGVDLLAPEFAPSPGLVDTLSGETLSVSGTQWLSERSWLRVTASGSRLRSQRPALLGAQSLGASALRFDAGFGDFAGSLTGHRSESRLDRRAWFDVDLGVSWRTPWSGRLTVGARNLLGGEIEGEVDSGDPKRMLETRTPYVRYQQDL